MCKDLNVVVNKDARSCEHTATAHTGDGAPHTGLYETKPHTVSRTLGRATHR